MLKIKIIGFSRDLSIKPSFFLKNLIDWHDEFPQCCCHTIIISFESEAFTFIGDVYIALFAMRSLKTLLEGNKTVFWPNIFYFSVCLTSNKLYWIEDQLADVSTQFYTSARWSWRVEPSVTWLQFILIFSLLEEKQ